MKEIEDILIKDGKDWTDEEARIIRDAAKERGRDFLKKLRKSMRESLKNG